MGLVMKISACDLTASYPMGTGFLSPKTKWPGREANHLPPSSAEVKTRNCYTSTPRYELPAWYVVKHRENFTFTYL